VAGQLVHAAEAVLNWALAPDEHLRFSGSARPCLGRVPSPHSVDDTGTPKSAGVAGPRGVVSSQALADDKDEPGQAA
jgi:hypothetical protein